MIAKSLLLCAALVLATGTVSANDRSPIKLVVGYAPGGTADIMARFYAERLNSQLKRPVIVENRPGGGGLIAQRAVAKAKPDGKTFLFAPMSGPLFRELTYNDKQRGYSMLTDYAPVATVSSHSLGMVVPTSLGVNNVQGLVEWIKQNPTQASYGSSTPGSHTHLLGIVFNQAANVKIEVIPYKGNSEVMTAILGSQLPMAIMAAPDWKAHLGGDRIKVLGTFTQERSTLSPDIPTLAEQGVPAFGGEGWMGFWAPANIAQPQLDPVQNALAELSADPATAEALNNNFSAQPMFLRGAEMDKRQRDDLEIWRGVIEAAGFTPDT
jgi:tripartite-type tricarboxylate transporter receptor subunit TctC